MRLRVTMLASLTALGAMSGVPAAADVYQTGLRIAAMTTAGPPRIVEETLVLTYAGEEVVEDRTAGDITVYPPEHPERRSARYVAARFERPGSVGELHLYRRNEQGVFVLPIAADEIPPGTRYRIVVDGVWQADPANPHRISVSGTPYSVVNYTVIPRPPAINPDVDTDGTTTFRFRHDPGRAIYLVGEFNTWNPFLHRMRESTGGWYTLTLKLLPGRHYYYYTLGGRRILDPRNTETATNGNGVSVSTFIVP